MLKDSLYKIISADEQENAVTAILEIDKDHEIFAGHFPGQPVLPGAVMLQIIKEILESTLNRSLQLKKAEQIKFLSMIDPRINSELKLTISYHTGDTPDIIVAATIITGTTTCLKFRGSFVYQ